MRSVNAVTVAWMMRKTIEESTLVAMGSGYFHSDGSDLPLSNWEASSNGNG